MRRVTVQGRRANSDVPHRSNRAQIYYGMQRLREALGLLATRCETAESAPHTYTNTQPTDEFASKTIIYEHADIACGHGQMREQYRFARISKDKNSA